MAMKITLALSLLLMAGCYGAPEVSGFGYGDKRACVNLTYGKPYLVLVTNGHLGSYGVRSFPFLPPHFSGTLGPQGVDLPYSAWGRRLSIGENKYDLTQGRLLAVSFASGTPVIRQIDLPLRDMVRVFVEEDAELRAFFPDKKPPQPNADRGE
jgi:hypothetical protein